MRNRDQELQILLNMTTGALQAATHDAAKLEDRVVTLTEALREARQWIETGCDHFENSEAVVRYLDHTINAQKEAKHG